MLVQQLGRMLLLDAMQRVYRNTCTGTWRIVAILKEDTIIPNVQNQPTGTAERLNLVRRHLHRRRRRRTGVART